MADYPIEDDRSRDHVTCSGSLSLGNAPGHQGNPVGKEEAAEDGESSVRAGVVFWAITALHLWEDEEKQHARLHSQMFPTEQAPSACFSWRHFPIRVKCFSEEVKSVPLPCSPFAQC